MCIYVNSLFLLKSEQCTTEFNAKAHNFGVTTFKDPIKLLDVGTITLGRR